MIAFRFSFSRACYPLKVSLRLPPTGLFSHACYPSCAYFEFWLVDYADLPQVFFLIELSRVVPKPGNANPRLKVNQSINFSCLNMLFGAYVLSSLRLFRTNNIKKKLHRKVTNWNQNSLYSWVNIIQLRITRFWILFKPVAGELRYITPAKGINSHFSNEAFFFVNGSIFFFLLQSAKMQFTTSDEDRSKPVSSGGASI